MKVDKNYCMSSFLQFRFVFNRDILFKEGLKQKYYDVPKGEYKIKDYEELDKAIKDYIAKNYDDKTVLMLSGGIDSAIIAKYLPKGAMTFTLKCFADGATTDEVPMAKKFASINNLRNEIIEVTWDDYERYCDNLLAHKKAPFHSIEVQIYKAALRAKELGYNKLLFGESADVIFGGMDGLLSKDWVFEDFVKRYNYVNPKEILKDAVEVLEPYEEYRQANNLIDFYGFVSNKFYEEATNSYMNACETAGLKFLSPYNVMRLNGPIDLNRIRNGESKYIVRDLFKKLYPDIIPNKKIPMPRPMELWLKNWGGPKRKEFKNTSLANLSGDAKWLVYILEKFLNYYDVGE